MNAHVCRCPKRLTQHLDSGHRNAGAGDFGRAESRSEPQKPKRARRDGRPLPPPTERHQGTTSGVRIAPMLVPALKMPSRAARSRCGKPFGDGLIGLKDCRLGSRRAPRARTRPRRRLRRKRGRSRRHSMQPTRSPTPPHRDPVDNAASDEEPERIAEAEPRDDIPIDSSSAARRWSAAEDAKHLAVASCS